MDQIGLGYNEAEESIQMKYGFIYCIGNKAMPGIYKIGMTDRAPAQRCQELSSSTSTPLPFDVLCFAQVEDPRSVEAELHDYFSAFRVNGSREFFRTRYSEIKDVMLAYSEGFAETQAGGEEREREHLLNDFLSEKDEKKKARALLTAAAFDGVRVYREGDELKVRGGLDVSTWMSGAIHLMRPVLLEVITPCPIEVAAAAKAIDDFKAGVATVEAD